ncbi:MAG: hypothetical protein ACI9XR_000174 [Flavobacterium sp.]|jgi:hypothetical protein
MNSNLLYNLLRFILLLAAQVLVFNNINFLGYINPYPYVLFVLLYPVNSNKYGLLIASFLLGITLDYFTDSGGVHAASCLILAMIRPSIFRFSFGLSYEYQTVKINDNLTPERFSFILLAIVIHHYIMYTLELFEFQLILIILWRTLISSIFTIIIGVLLIYLFKPSKR